ncbi:MAG TPA: DUF305 domain-containing protein [Oceanobacillus sp.]|nr:DUF305 domain-containing protein [Oceanobacillus sp.]
MRVILTICLLLLSVSLATAEGPVEGRAGRAEVRFLEGMIDHHQLALDMANDCLAKASTEGVTELCQMIIDVQSSEIEQMREWLLAWYNIEYRPISMYNPSDDMGGMDHGDMQMDEPVVDPPMMMGMMAGLNRLEGLDYEIAWLESMIDHHDDALHMSERVLERAEHEELRTLAENIIAAQSAEIATMEAMIAELMGEG